MTFEEKIQKAKDVLTLAAKMSKEFYNAPLIITYSGGKDSDVMLDIAEKCLAKDDFEVVNNHTTVDAPETVYYIRDKFKRLEADGISARVHYPKKSMWQLIKEKNFPPTQIARYCCKELKENSAPNRILAVGVRSDESVNRRGRDAFEKIGKTKKDAKVFSLEHAQEVYEESHEGLGDAFDCIMIAEMKEKKLYRVNPIYEFSESDVWQYIHTYMESSL